MRDGLYTLGIPGPGAARTCAGAQKGQVSLRKFPQLDHMPWKKPLKTSQHPEIEVPQTTSEVPKRDAAASQASSGGIPAVRTPRAAAGAAIQLVTHGTAAVPKALIDIGKDGMNAAAHIHKQPGGV